MAAATISGEDKASAEFNQNLQKNDEMKAWNGGMGPIDLKMQNSSSEDKPGKGKFQKRYWTEQEVSKVYFILKCGH